MRGEYTFGARLVGGIGAAIAVWLPVFIWGGLDWVVACIFSGVFFILGFIIGPKVTELFD
jgi:hypothetical protein